jgi:hypothetical protein
MSTPIKGSMDPIPITCIRPLTIARTNKPTSFHRSRRFSKAKILSAVFIIIVSDSEGQNLGE